MKTSMLPFALVAMLTLVSGRTSAQARPTDPAAALHELQERYWQWRLREFPELATWQGDPRYNDRFTDLSATAIARRRADVRRMRDEARAIAAARLDGQDAISHALLVWELDLAVDGQRFPTEVMLLDQLDGPQLGFVQLASVSPFATVKDYRDYVSRLEAWPRYLEQVTTLLRSGMGQRWTQPAGPLRSVPDQIEGQIVDDPTRSPLYGAFEKMPADIPAVERERLRGEAREAIANRIVPALRSFRDFVRTTYLPAGRPAIAASTLPEGRAYYAYQVRASTTTSLGPDSIHRIGLAEVRRIRAAMDSVVRAAGFTGTFAAFLEHLRTDPRFYHTNGEDLLTGYRDIAKRADAELPKLFAELPRNTYGVRPFPDFEAPSQTTARYYQGAEDGSRAGYYMVNLYRPEMRPKYEMEALTLHEAVPGHHLQISRAQELKGLPAFRRNAGYTAFVEGWALYAESLGPEMGFYMDPYSKFGQLTYEMWRACRLVVDTGMHHLGWSRQQAIDFMTANTAKSEQDIIVEIDRYIVWPGQALAYKLGELRIKELRARAERELGARFDLRRFHNAVLDNGPLPLDVLEREIGRWIEAERTTP